MLKPLKHVMLLCLLLSLASCASNTTIGDDMIAQGEESEKLGKTWNKSEVVVKKGNKEVMAGEANIHKGKKLIRKGESQVRAGNSKIQKGERQISKTERKFHNEFPDVPLGE